MTFMLYNANFGAFSNISTFMRKNLLCQQFFQRTCFIPSIHAAHVSSSYIFTLRTLFTRVCFEKLPLARGRKNSFHNHAHMLAKFHKNRFDYHHAGHFFSVPYYIWCSKVAFWNFSLKLNQFKLVKCNNWVENASKTKNIRPNKFDGGEIFKKIKWVVVKNPNENFDKKNYNGELKWKEKLWKL